MDVTCKLKFETEAQAFWVKIGQEDLTFVTDTASFTTIVGEDRYMAWGVAGESETSYKITISPPSVYEVRTVGKHPVEGRIPKTTNSTASTRRFYIRKKKS